MKVAIYARVSTEEQAKKENSIPMQKAECMQIIKNNNNFTLQDFYSDPGISAAHTNRPSLQRMLKNIEKKKIDIVLVWKLDRLSRDLLDSIQFVKKWEEDDCHLKSATEPFDTSDLYGRQMFYNLAIFAEYERNLTGERQRSVLKNKALAGKWPSGEPPYGYKIGENSVLIPDPEQSEIVKLIFDFYVNKGMGYLRICKYLNEHGVPAYRGGGWSETSIKGMLKNPVYIGKIVFGKTTKKYINNKIVAKKLDNPIYVNGLHEKLIPIELWEDKCKIMESKKIDKKYYYTKNKTHLVTTLLLCECGAKMYANRREHFLYYRCKDGYHAANTCKRRKYVSRKQVDEGILFYFRQLLTDDFIKSLEQKFTDSQSKAPLKQDNKKAILLKSLKEQKTLEENLMAALIRKVIGDEDFISQRGKIKEKIKNIQTELNAIEQSIAKLPKEVYKKRIKAFKKLQYYVSKPLKKMSADDILKTRALLAELITEMTLTYDNKLIISVVKL